MDSKPDTITRTEVEKLFHQLNAEIAELKLTRAQKAIRMMRRNKRATLAIAAMAMLIPVALYAVSITKSFTFVAGNPTVASEINTNFDQLFTKVNDLAAFHPPIGTILAWHKSLGGATPGLPTSGEWVECNGQILGAIGSVYDGLTIPNLNGDPGGVNSPGQSAKIAMFLRGGLTSGTGQDDRFQGHWHSYTLFSFGLAGSVVDVMRSDGTPGSTSGNLIGSPVTDGTNGTPRTASETRPVNMSVVWILKVK